jgi:hypothetical protein
MLGSETKTVCAQFSVLLVFGIEPACRFHIKWGAYINSTSKFCFFGQSWHSKGFVHLAFLLLQLR